MQLFIILYTFALSFGIASASVLNTRARVVPLDEIYTLAIYAPCEVECDKLHVTHQTLSGLFNGTSFEDFPAGGDEEPERKAAEIQFDSTTQLVEPRQFWVDHVPSDLHLVCSINFAKRPIVTTGRWSLSSQTSQTTGEVGGYGQYTGVEGADDIWVACANADA